MKTRIIFALALLLLLPSAYLSAQSLRDHKWVLSAGMGLGEAEATSGMALATGAYVGYRVNAFEFGLGFQHISQKSMGNGLKQGLQIDLNTEDMIRTSIAVYNDAPKGLYSGNSYSVNFVVGVDPLAFIRQNDRHRLFLGVMAGIGGSIKTNYYTDGPRYGMQILTRGPFSWGGKLEYEYLLTDRLGIGLATTYDRSIQSLYSLATLSVHF